LVNLCRVSRSILAVAISLDAESLAALIGLSKGNSHLSFLLPLSLYFHRAVALNAKMSTSVPFLKDPTYPEGMIGDARFDPLGLAENFDIKV